VTGVQSQRGFTLIEIMMAVGLIGVVTAISVPVFIQSMALNSLWTGSELIGSTIRQTRLKAVSENSTYRVVFSCPSAGSLRSLVVTGDPLVDDAVDRCNQTLDGDSGIFQMPASVTYDPDLATALQVTGRGIFTAIGDSIPLTISVNYGASLRTLTVSATGQLTFSHVQ